MNMVIAISTTSDVHAMVALCVVINFRLVSDNPLDARGM